MPTMNPTKPLILWAKLTLMLDFDSMQRSELETALTKAIDEVVNLKDTEPSALKYSFERGSIIATVSLSQTHPKHLGISASFCKAPVAQLDNYA